MRRTAGAALGGDAAEVAHASHQLRHREGLHEVVVAAGFEASDAIGNRVLRRQEEGGHGVPLQPQLFDQTERVATGDGTVEDKAVVRVYGHCFARLGEVGRHVHGEARGAQAALHDPTQLDVVLEQEQAHRAGRRR